ncbi:MAG: GNAT family N-acetyltransferase [Smithellaceae bacterium]|nr:GNAT family N-acetyltransferase [Syntrophaceae bacterium]MDD4240195.1 GNAT family N-acetyltransferase [Smithellaceae bacterium]NLX51395.1 GNAT family N-acetyltransferase [Deltaproteobacteria bacterium]
MKTGIASADLNMAWNEKPLLSGDAQAVREVRKYYEQDKLPFWWWVFPGAQSPATNDLLRGEGLVPVESIPSMLADLNRLPEPEAAASVVRVENERQRLAWAEVAFAGFDFPSCARASFYRFVEALPLGSAAPQKLLMAFADSTPAATAILFQNGPAAGIYFVTTLAAHRKKGIGREITHAAMRTAGQAGARWITLQAAPEGLSVYRQAGFAKCGSVEVYSPLTDGGFAS